MNASTRAGQHRAKPAGGRRESGHIRSRAVAPRARNGGGRRLRGTAIPTCAGSPRARHRAPRYAPDRCRTLGHDDEDRRLVHRPPHLRPEVAGLLLGQLGHRPQVALEVLRICSLGETEPQVDEDRHVERLRRLGSRCRLDRRLAVRSRLPVRRVRTGPAFTDLRWPGRHAPAKMALRVHVPAQQTTIHASSMYFALSTLMAKVQRSLSGSSLHDAQ